MADLIDNNPNILLPSVTDILLARQLITPDLLNQYCQKAKLEDQSIENYLFYNGLIEHKALQEAIAHSNNLQIDFNPDLETTPKLRLDQQNGYNLISGYGALNMQITRPIAKQNIEFSDHFGFGENIGYSENIANIVPSNKTVTARDFRRLFIKQNKSQICHQAANLLPEHYPQLTAKSGFNMAQKIFIICLSVSMFGLLLFNPLESLVVFSFLSSCLFCLSAFIKLHSLLFIAKNLDEIPSPINLHELPIYSILVPLYKEANIIEQLTQNLLKLDYPKAKLDIKLLFEEDDYETIQKAQSLHLPECFEFIIIPNCLPRTKPKAMNFALPFIKGEFVTIYDAEDRPQSDQLLKAVQKFQNNDDDLICLQAKLEYENWNKNWLTKHFFIEYATQFSNLLPSIEKLTLPMPLGGTSNHFKVQILRQLLGWDAYNVTEDADLGVRLALFGYRSGMLNSTTYETATDDFPAWLKQRTRWLKGWIQTFVTYSRAPQKLYKILGFKRFWGFLILITNMLVAALLHPIIFFMPIYIFTSYNFEFIFSSTLYISLFYFSIFSLFLGYIIAFCSNYKAIKIHQKPQLYRSLFSTIIYWLLISLAAWLAVFDYFIRPHYWAKTVHKPAFNQPKHQTDHNDANKYL